MPIIMGMDIINPMTNYLTKPFFLTFLCCWLMLCSNSVWAFNWLLRPSLKLEQIFSDNINLSSLKRQSALVTEVSPGFSVSTTSSINRFNLNYRMQNLYNASGRNGLNIKNQLQMNSLYQLVRNRLYVNSSSSISQQNISNRRIVGDNIAGGNNSTTVSTFQLSPYWTPHFKNFVNSNIRLTFDRVNSSGGKTNLTTTNSLTENINLTSGRYFDHISWSLSFNNRNQNNKGGQNVNFQDSTAEIRYAWGQIFNVFARLGQSNNSFANHSKSSQNGISYTFGGQWKPSQRLRIEAGYGNNRFITIDILPFNRLRWITTYRNNHIGLNTGDVWNTVLNYSTRRSIWSLTYNEQTVTTQKLLLDQQIFTTTDAFGQPQTNAVATQDTSFNIRLPSLTNEVFITKNADISVSFRTGKSNLSADLYQTRRVFQQSGNRETVTGISASWNWRFSNRTQFLLSSNWQQTRSKGTTPFSDQRFNVKLAVTRNIFARLNGKIDYRFVDQNSDDHLNTYSENRISANLLLQF